MTSEIKTYAKRFNAQRAAKAAIGKDAAEGNEFETCKASNGEWYWFEPRKIAALNPAMITPIEQAYLDQEVRDYMRHDGPTLPTPPDFSAPSHKYWRKRHAELVALAESGDVDGLRAFPLPDYSSSPKALNRYRNAAIAALTGGK